MLQQYTSLASSTEAGICFPGLLVSKAHQKSVRKGDTFAVRVDADLAHCREHHAGILVREAADDAGNFPHALR